MRKIHKQIVSVSLNILIKSTILHLQLSYLLKSKRFVTIELKYGYKSLILDFLLEKVLFF